MACKFGKKNHSLSNRCGLIIINVLKKCRHKGAIEAAGLALGELVEFVSKDPTCFEFTFTWLQECLDSIGISNSITRRSAGMAILVHQIVAHDQRLEKVFYIKLIVYFFFLIYTNIALLTVSHCLSYV